MPYNDIDDLPDSVKNNLTPKAKKIYLEAYNSAWEEYKDPEKRRGNDSHEEVSHKVAWSAVKQKYEKDHKLPALMIKFQPATLGQHLSGGLLARWIRDFRTGRGITILSPRSDRKIVSRYVSGSCQIIGCGQRASSCLVFQGGESATHLEKPSPHHLARRRIKVKSAAWYFRQISFTGACLISRSSCATSSAPSSCCGGL